MQSDTNVLEMETSIEIYLAASKVLRAVTCEVKSHHRVGQIFESCSQRAQRGPLLELHGFDDGQIFCAILYLSTIFACQ
jgi:hypothetical protein